MNRGQGRIHMSQGEVDRDTASPRPRCLGRSATPDSPAPISGGVYMKAGRDSRRSAPRGSVLIELALILPLLVVLVFGAIDYAYQFHVLHRMTNAARDAARSLAVQGATVSAATDAALNELSDINAQFSVTATLPPTGSTTNHDVIVNISVPQSSISLGIFTSSGRMEAKATMRKEGT